MAYNVTMLYFLFTALYFVIHVKCKPILLFLQIPEVNLCLKNRFPAGKIIIRIRFQTQNGLPDIIFGSKKVSGFVLRSVLKVDLCLSKIFCPETDFHNHFQVGHPPLYLAFPAVRSFVRPFVPAWINELRTFPQWGYGRTDSLLLQAKVY